MENTPKSGIKLFYCYAREDKLLRDKLETHLAWLKRRYQVTTWYDREILPGQEWEQAIDKQLNTAHIILLLISSDFMASDYIHRKEMRRALERHKEGNCCVIPILLRSCYWQGAPFSSLQLLPTTQVPITSWPNLDEAFQDVVAEISRTIENQIPALLRILVPFLVRQGSTILDNLSNQIVDQIVDQIGLAVTNSKTKEEWLQEGRTLLNLNRYEEALNKFERAIYRDPNFANAYYFKSLALENLNRYEEADQAYEKARQLGFRSQ